MNIGLFTDTYFPSINGIVTSIETFKKELEDSGHNVFVFCPKVRNGLKNQNDGVNNGTIIPYFSFPYPLLREFRLVIPLPLKLRKIRRLHLDIIHFHTPFLMGLFAKYLSKRLKVPLIQTYHTYLAEYVHYVPLPKKIIKSLAIWASREYCNASTFVISPSLYIKNVLLGYGVKSHIIIIPTGIEIIDQNSISQTEIRKKYGIPFEKNILISVGRLAKEKNMAFLIRVLKYISKHLPKTCLVLIGDGPERTRLAHLANKLGLKQQVIFLGFIVRSEVMKIISASDLFVFASRTETQGVCLLEALAAGKPAVAIEATGVVDVMKGDKGGFLVQGDEIDFADKVISLLKDSLLFSRKVKEAHDVAQLYSSSHLARMLISCYEKACKKYKKK